MWQKYTGDDLVLFKLLYCRHKASDALTARYENLTL
jgi:hypothetical protein